MDQWDQLYSSLGQMGIDEFQIKNMPPFLDPLAKTTLGEVFNQGCYSDSWVPNYPENMSNSQRACLMAAFQAGKACKHILKKDTTSTPSPPSAPQMKEPKVDFYEGDQSKFQNFTYEIAALFAACPGVYQGKEQAKMLAIFTRLRGAAQAWARPHMNKTTAEIDFKDADTFLKALGDAFDDPDQTATAERQIFSLKQTGNVSSYHSEFVTYATKLGWTEGTFPIALFHKGLSDHLKDVIATHIHSAPKDSLDKYANWVMALDNSLTARKEEKKSAFFSFNPKSSSQPPSKGHQQSQHKQNSFPSHKFHTQSGWSTFNQPRQQSWSFSKPSAPPQSHQRAASTPHFNKGDPMEVDAISLPFKYKDGKKGAWAVGICWKCGKNHHMKQCPQYKPQAHAMQTFFSPPQLHYPQSFWPSHGQQSWGPPPPGPSAPSAPVVQQVQTAPKPPAQQSAAPPSKN